MYEKITFGQKEKARLMKAFSHPARIFMLEAIAEKRICVCSLARSLNLSFAAVSRHFGVLRNAGIVEEDKEGNNIYYRLASDCVLELLQASGKAGRCLAVKRKRL
ncbi:MAG: ArsR family transcriptional regulator [Elusimicrobia bacterium CG08_land_8_20_14_0_20_51_18]|nr:MAG: ArsR family transcriptional regulator [Elusimicrobia bacterium CG08_land_8_20_14_0_20_51_18]